MSPATTSGNRLSPEDIRCYHDHGYALPGQQILSTTELDELQSCFERIQEDGLPKWSPRTHGRPALLLSRIDEMAVT